MLHPNQTPPVLDMQRVLQILRENPNHALIQGFVVDDSTFRPVTGARVAVSGQPEQTMTATNGYFEILTKAAPSSDLPEYDPPTATILITAPAYKTQNVTGVSVAGGGSVVTVELGRGIGTETSQIPGSRNKQPQEQTGAATPANREYLKWISDHGGSIQSQQLGKHEETGRVRERGDLLGY